jgi:DNA adenine methylase
MSTLPSSAESPIPWSPPILRWAGSKRKLVPTLMANAPSNYERYIEAFAGSACLLFALHPKHAVLNDINEQLIESYLVLRDHPRLLARGVHALPNTKREYYRQRSLDTSTLQPLDRAIRFIYLNRNCFNGVYRTNRQGVFNVPRGKKTGSIPTEQEFYRCSVALRDTDLRALDFENCLADVKKGDFVYLDPPYSTSSRPRYGEYGYASFQPIDVTRLVGVLRMLDQRGSHFLLSYAGGKSVKRSFSEWNCQSIRVRRHVAGFVDHRTVVDEILVSNYSSAEGSGE